MFAQEFAHELIIHGSLTLVEFKARQRGESAVWDIYNVKLLLDDRDLDEDYIDGALGLGTLADIKTVLALHMADHTDERTGALV